jgi:hypothetical protein
VPARRWQSMGRRTRRAWPRPAPASAAARRQCAYSQPAHRDQGVPSGVSSAWPDSRTCRDAGLQATAKPHKVPQHQGQGDQATRQQSFGTKEATFPGSGSAPANAHSQPSHGGRQHRQAHTRSQSDRSAVSFRARSPGAHRAPVRGWRTVCSRGRDCLMRKSQRRRPRIALSTAMGWRWPAVPPGNPAINFRRRSPPQANSSHQQPSE